MENFRCALQTEYKQLMKLISITDISHRKYSTPTHEAGRTCSITNISHRRIEGHSWVLPRANPAFSAMQPLCFFLFRSPFAATCMYLPTRPRKCVEWHPLSLPSLQHPGLSIVLWLAMLAMFGCPEWGTEQRTQHDCGDCGVIGGAG
jgi:hypothetical protein